MIFNSIAFLIFLPVVFILYWFVFNRSLKWQNLLLLVASYFFYGWWSWKFLGLLALSTLLDYFYGFGVAAENPRKSKYFLWLSVVNNLGILAVFKYYDFFAKEFATGLNQIGFHVEPYLLNLALPIGISFYTFHGMSYVFDIYRKKQEPVRNIVDYAVFVSFFPLLVAGPIERASHLLPQVQGNRIFSTGNAVSGTRLILWGLFKKIVIADGISEFVNDCFINYTNHSSTTLLLGAVSFSIQIYCDFSGYSDIAIGVAKLFGFELLSNFKFPYFSRNISEFWKRWHISLSSWFKDYLYIPLGGSKVSSIITIRNTFIIFLVSGFWHGASWNYIIWGVYHSIAFMPMLISPQKKLLNGLSNTLINHSYNFREVLAIIRTFFIVTLGWIFFRSETISQSIGYLSKLVFDFIHLDNLIVRPKGLFVIPYFLVLFYFDWRFKKNERDLVFFKSRYLNYFLYIVFSLLIIKYFVKGSEVQEFIYFQF